MKLTTPERPSKDEPHDGDEHEEYEPRRWYPLAPPYQQPWPRPVPASPNRSDVDASMEGPPG